jgi:phosphoglycerate dehydrogenase-like enzyme
VIAPQHTERSLTVLLSSSARPEFIAAVEAAGPRISVLTLDNESPLPSLVASAQVLHRSITFSRARIAEIINAATELEWMHIPFAGVDGLLPPGLAERKVVVTHASGIYDAPVAEFALAQILSIAKRLPFFAEEQRARRWAGVRTWDDASGSSRVPTMIRGKTIGIVGFGGIGGTLAECLRPLGARVLGLRRSGLPDPRAEQIFDVTRLVDIFAACDFVVLALPLTPETRQIIGAAELAAMQPDAWLLNFGRGALVDDAALLEALERNAIGGACLDVFSEEPLPADHPYYRLPNVILTPHVSGVFQNRSQADLDRFVSELKRFLEGEPFEGPIDLARGY